MNRTVRVQIQDFDTVPNLLRADPQKNVARDRLEIHLGKLFHQYYLDSYGVSPPEPDYINFEYIRFLTNTADFRFQNDGPGTSTAKRRNISTELGQAFFRLFLQDICGIPYFAHLEKIIDKDLPAAFGGVKIQRVSNGDIPDYFCAKNVRRFFIGEAKGRFSSISFSNKSFGQWRNQFHRIRIIEPKGNPIKTKGYIVGTRFSTESQPRTFTEIFAEDPEVPGEISQENNFPQIGRLIIANHYARVISKLGLRIVSFALSEGFSIPNELSFNLPIWKCQIPPFQGLDFVGGVISDDKLDWLEKDGLYIHNPNIMKLNEKTPIFLGLEKNTFRQLWNACKGNFELIDAITPYTGDNVGPSDLGWANDYSISGSIQYFILTGIETFD